MLKFVVYFFLLLLRILLNEKIKYLKESKRRNESFFSQKIVQD